MCGRYTAAFDADRFEAAFGVRPPAGFAARYNITPGRPVLALRAAAGDAAGGGGRVEAVPMHWGMLPPWSRDPGDRGAQINARSETAATKPMFRDAFRRRRCLIPADGFYEWRRGADAGGGGKQPYFVALRDGAPFAFAGLWQRLRDGNGKPFDSCAILTTDADELIRPIHHRMPVILPAERYAAWLDPELQDPTRVAALLVPLPAAEMVAYPVGRRVNDPRYDDPGLREPAPATAPAAEEERQGSLF